MRRVNKGQVPARRQAARHFTTLDCSRRRRCALIPGQRPAPDRQVLLARGAETSTRPRAR